MPYHEKNILLYNKAYMCSNYLGTSNLWGTRQY